MNALEVLYTGHLLAGLQYDRDVEEAYAEDAQRRQPVRHTGYALAAIQHLDDTGFWRDAGLGVEQWVEPK